MRLISSPPWGGMRWLVEAVKCEASWIFCLFLSSTFIVFDWITSQPISIGRSEIRLQILRERKAPKNVTQQSITYCWS